MLLLLPLLLLLFCTVMDTLNKMGHVIYVRLFGPCLFWSFRCLIEFFLTVMYSAFPNLPVWISLTYYLILVTVVYVLV